jgi:transcriptional regulator with XRE-family HTH domain
MNKLARLKELRLKKSWRLCDVAGVLGVTEATLSRWERGLQEPPRDILTAWEQIVTGQKLIQVEARRPRLNRRVILGRLADFFLADVIAGKGGRDAGWRHMAEVGVGLEDVPSFKGDIEVRGRDTIRISYNSRLPSVEQAKNVLGYWRAVSVEERQLVDAGQRYISPLFDGLRDERTSGSIVLAGLAEMICANGPFVETSRNMLDNDPTTLAGNPMGAASCIMGVVHIAVSDNVRKEALHRLYFKSPRETLDGTSESADSSLIARELGVYQTAQELGRDAIIALGVAWSFVRMLEDQRIGVCTDVGRRHLGEIFWGNLKDFGISRVDIAAVWQRVMVDEMDCQNEKQQIGHLLWAWPEEF